MRVRGRILSAGCVVVLAGVVATPAAHASSPNVYSAWAGGTTVHLLGGAVYSDQTAMSGVTTTRTGQHAGNQLAAVAVPHVASVGVVTTSSSTSALPGGGQVQASAQTAGINLLGGLITASAATTTGTVRQVNGRASYSGGTQLLNLQIAGARIPITVAPNTTITIPNIASVTINRVVGSYQGNAYATVDAEALRVTLLGAYGSTPAGSTIDLSPVHAAISSSSPLAGDAVGGQATSAEVDVAIKLLGLSTVTVGPLSATKLDAGGTGGNDVSNSTLGTNIPGILVAQVASTTANGSVDSSFSRATESVSLANVNLLNGLITAQALTGSTTSSAPRSGAVISTASSKLVNLTIGGAVVPINVAPNTSITIPGVVTVTINRQVRTATGITQQILDVKVLGGGLPLPIGAEVQIGATNTWVGTPG